MPEFTQCVIEFSGLESRSPKTRLPKTITTETSPSAPSGFVSEKNVHDCIMHAIRDEESRTFWRAVEFMPQSVADTMPAAFIPFTTRSPSGYESISDGWGGRWPVGMVGMTFNEAESVLSFAASFAEWSESRPHLVMRILSKNK